MNEPDLQPEPANIENPLIPDSNFMPPNASAPRRDNASESEAGTEVIIYNEPQEIPEESNFHIIMYIFLLLATDLVFKIIFASMLIHMNHSDKKSFAPLVLLLAILHIWKITYNIFYLVVYGNRVPGFRNVYIFDIILSIGYICVAWSFYMYLSGKIDAASLPLFVVPHIILTLIRFCVGEALNTPFLPFSFLVFVESLELLYIALKISNPSGYADWTWVLLYFYILALLLLFLAYLLSVVLIILIGTWIFKPEVFREADPIAVLFVTGLIFYITWNGFVYYYLLSGFHTAMVDGHIAPGKAAVLNSRIVVTVYVMMVCAIITLIILIIFLIYLRETLARMFSQGKATEISLQNFAKGLNLGVMQQSGNYFKKREEKDIEQPEGGNNPEIGTCIICCDKQSEVMIHPCGHSGICKDCMTECLKRSDKCPHCKQKMDKIYLIYYDHDKKSYMAKGALKFKNNG